MMNKTKATITLHQSIASGSEYELIKLLFAAVQQLEKRGYHPEEIEKMIDEALNQLLPRTSFHRLAA
jgi:hypothetical protein